MPVLDHKILSELAARATELAAEVHTNVLMKRSVDHRVLETLAVGMFEHSQSLKTRRPANILKLPHVSSASEATCTGPSKSKANRCIDYSNTNQAWRSGFAFSHLFGIHKYEIIFQRATYH